MDPKKPEKPESFNPRAIFSKTGKGVQEASGKTSHLSRADRAVLSAIDGKTMLSDVSAKFEKLTADKFDALMHQLDKDGFIREVTSGQSAAPTARPAAPVAKTPPKAPPPPADDGDEMDFTQAVKIPKGPAPAAPKGPPVDLAASARADAERKQKEEQALDFRAREETEAKAKAEADLKMRAAAEARAKADAEARARAETEAKAKAEADAKSRAEADAKMRAESDAKVKAARDAAVRMATEAKARAEADAKSKTDAAERDKARLEAELNAKLDAERKAREDAEKRAAEASERAHKDLEEKSKRDAEELRQRLESEMKAKLDAERKAREEEDRKRREEDDRRRKEEDERRAKEDAERRAREEADRKKREEEDRKRREDDERRRKEDDERRASEAADRKKREEEDRKRREEDDRKRKEEDERRALEDTNRKLDLDRQAKQEGERRAKEEAERRAKEDADRRAKDDADRKAKADAERRAKEEAEAKARAAADAAASLPKVDSVAPPAAPAAAGGFGDSLLADLDSFGKREEEEQKEKEEAERKAKEAAARKAKEDAERRAKEEAESKRRAEEERRRKEEEERRAKEEAERKAREEEERLKEEEDERKRKAKEALAAKQAEERAAKAGPAAGAGRKAAGDDDIEVSEDDLDKDDLKRDQKVAAERARKVAREVPPVAVATGGGRKKWGKPVAIALFALLLVGVAALNFMPLSTAEYEKAASDAMGVPVKISSARLSALAGIEVRLEGVTVGGAKISKVRGSPEVGSLFGARKAFSKVELEGVSVSQAQLGDALLGKVAGENLRVGRIVIKQLVLEGPLKLPALDVDAAVGGDGTLQTVKLTGADKFIATLSPKGSDIAFEISAGSFTPPFVPGLSLSEFAMKGTANRSGVVTSEFDGRAFDGVISGTSRILWGDSWTVEGELRARTLKVAVFAPTLVSEGRVEGKAAYKMTGSTPATLYESARMQGEFKIDKGVLGSFDLQRALQTSGNQSAGRTIFNEMTGQGLYDKGTAQFTNVTISAGAMNAGASLTIDGSGNLSGRIVADVKTASQRQGATLNISGKLQDPVIRK